MIESKIGQSSISSLPIDINKSLSYNNNSTGTMLANNNNNHRQKSSVSSSSSSSSPCSSTSSINDNGNNNAINDDDNNNKGIIQHQQQHQQQQHQRRKYPNYFNYIKRSTLNRGTFEINGRHNECILRKDNVFYVKNLKFPDCVVRNLCQIYKYKGEPWFINHSMRNNQRNDIDGDSSSGNDDVSNDKNELNINNNGVGDEYETIYEKIHVELNDFYSFIKPLKEDDILRKATYFCITDSLKKLSFVRHVKYYGSYSSKTYLPVSDIDLVVYCSIVNDDVQTLFHIAERLSYDGLIENRFNIIPLSRIPLLKFNDSLTGLPINITLNTDNVMERSKYIREQIRTNSHQMKILLFLKYYLLSKGSNQVYYGGIGSYALALMVIRFFQEESVKVLIENEYLYENSILGFLLMAFFERFGDVNFFKNHIITVNNNGDYIECDYIPNNNNSNNSNNNNNNGNDDNNNKSSNNDNRINNQHQQQNEKKKVSILRIKDHIEPWNDVSYGSFNSAEILKDFQYLHDKFMKSDKLKYKSLLGQVLYVVDSFIEYRNLLLYLFRKWFHDYDVNEYLNGNYSKREKYENFIEKRRIFQKKNLIFYQTCLPDKSLEFRFESCNDYISSSSSSIIPANAYPRINGKIIIDNNENDEDIENRQSNIYNHNHNNQRSSNYFNHFNNNYNHRNNFNNNQNRHHFNQHHHHHNNVTLNNANHHQYPFDNRSLNNSNKFRVLNVANNHQQDAGTSFGHERFGNYNHRNHNDNNTKRYKPGYMTNMSSDNENFSHNHQQQQQQRMQPNNLMKTMMMMMSNDSELSIKIDQQQQPQQQQQQQPHNNKSSSTSLSPSNDEHQPSRSLPGVPTTIDTQSCSNQLVTNDDHDDD